MQQIFELRHFVYRIGKRQTVLVMNIRVLQLPRLAQKQLFKILVLCLGLKTLNTKLQQNRLKSE